jgi:Spy/CpxP family protein refolding chaperone
MKKAWEGVEPQVKEEYRCSRRDIFEILTPEQKEKMKQRWRRMRNGGTNMPTASMGTNSTSSGQ